MLVRFMLCKSNNHSIRPSAFGYELESFDPFHILIDDYSTESIEISNPFPDKQQELVIYLKNGFVDIKRYNHDYRADVFMQRHL